jgi:hypothetical protein
MVAGQTNTGENIRCIIQMFTGTHIQKGSLKIRKKGTTTNNKITLK